MAKPEFRGNCHLVEVIRASPNAGHVLATANRAACRSGSAATLAPPHWFGH
jgi:hypothetical protein